MTKDHLQGSLNYITHRATNAVTESRNLKIQIIKSCTRGLRTLDNNRVAILLLYGKLQLYSQ